MVYMERTCGSTQPVEDPIELKGIEDAVETSVANRKGSTSSNSELKANETDSTGTLGVKDSNPLMNSDTSRRETDTFISEKSDTPKTLWEKIFHYVCLCGGCCSFLFLVCVFSALTGLLMGYDMCVVAVVLDPIDEYFNLCGSEFACAQKSLFVSIMAPGAAIGSILGGILSDKVGRRPGLCLSDIFLMLGSVFLGLGDQYWLMLIGRFTVGLGVGVGFVVYATYMCEISPTRIRGQLVACQEVAQCFGCMLAYVIAAIAGVTSWRYLLGLAGIVAAIQILGEAIILPESPRFRVYQGRLEEAAKAMLRLGVCKDQAEAQIMVQNIHLQHVGDSRPPGLSIWKYIKRRFQQLMTHRQAVFIAVGCAVAQDLTAANSVIYFSIEIFKLAGVCNPYIPGAGVGLMKLLGVVCCISLVEKAGRRILLLVGTAGTLLCHILMAIGFGLQDYEVTTLCTDESSFAGNSGIAGLTMCALVLYIFFWNLSWAALMFVVASEVLPNSIRGLAMGITITVFWMLAFVIQTALESMLTTMGKSGTFGFFAATNCLSLFFVVKYVPEGAGIELERM